MKKYPTLPPKQLQVHCVKEKVSTGDLKGAVEISRRLGNKRRLKQIRRDTIEVEQNTDIHSLSAVGIFKRGCDENDKYHIYRVNDSCMNRDPDYVFKTSKVMAEIGIQMDIDGPLNALQDEDAYFDGAHSRCKDFISLGLWVYHPSMRRLLRLANMEVRSESTEHIAMFWKLWNEVLGEVKGEVNYQFNPRKIMVDSGGANYCGVREVFGLEFCNLKLISCQWHFLHQIESSVTRLPPELRDDFVQQCVDLCNTTTIPQYQLIASRLKQISIQYQDIQNKLNWWHVRRYHVFGAFRNGPVHTGVNLAEMGNAQWKQSGRNLTLLAAAKDDVSTMILQENDVIQHRQNERTQGKGPNDLVRAALERRKQNLEAEGYAEVVVNKEAFLQQIEGQEEPQYFIPGERASHQAPKNSKNVQGSLAAPLKPKPARGRGRPKGRGTGRLLNTTPSLTDLAEKVIAANKIIQKKKTVHATTVHRVKTRSQAEETETVTPKQQQQQQQQERPTQLNSPYQARRSARRHNPPFVTFMAKAKYRCIGCNKWIEVQDNPPPRNMVFTLKAIRPYLNPRTQQWVEPERNGYLHLNITCLKKHDTAIELRQACMTDDVFTKCTKANLDYLQHVGLLEYIVQNKENTI